MRQDTKEALYAALTTAAEFIGSHGEEGGIGEETFEDESYTLDQYLKAANKVYTQLMKQAEKLRKTFE